MAGSALSPRAKLDRFHDDLVRERTDFEEVWRDCASFLLPAKPRHFLTDSNKPKRFGKRIVDPTGTHSLRAFKAGMVGIMCRPSTQWFSLDSPMGGPQRSLAVEGWMETFRDAVLDVFDRSNWYQAFAALCEDVGAFGTSPIIVLPDDKKLARFQVFPVLSYALGQDVTGRVNKISREFTMTLRQLLDEFGIENLPQRIRLVVGTGTERMEGKHVVRHAIFPNPDRGRGFGSRFLPFRECYWLKDSEADADQLPPQSGLMGPGVSDPVGPTANVEAEDGILRVSGYHEFPVAVARWSRNTEDAYATAWPGLDALPDVKELQARVRSSANAEEKGIDPPLKGGPGIKGKPVSQLPGKVTIDPDYNGPNTGLTNLHAPVTVRLDHMESKIEKIQRRIGRAFFEDLFLMLLNDARAQPPTALEVQERKMEKVQALGPVSEAFSDDVFDPVIERVTAMMIRASVPDWQMGQDGLLPMPPDELEGMMLRVEYTSEVAQAQRFVGVTALERHWQFVLAGAEADPSMLDNVNRDAMVRIHREGMGVSPRIGVEAEEVAAMRAARQEQREAAALLEQAPALAGGAKALSETRTGTGSALDQVLTA